jgi:hypothetical protein
MTIFTDIAAQYILADSAFAQGEQAAFDANDDAAFDLASAQRRHNDQAYFLYLFTRFENAVNRAVDALLAIRLGVPWAERRIWEAWSRVEIRDIHLLSKIEVLIDKSTAEFRDVHSYYRARNLIAHGEDWESEFLVTFVAHRMDAIVTNFVVA